jgi:hypothetical protein
MSTSTSTPTSTHIHIPIPTSNPTTNKAKSTISNRAILIADGIGRIIQFIGEYLFTFVVNGKEFTIPIIEALLLSPHVANELNQDNTTQRYVIEDSRLESESFDTIVSLFRKERIFLKSSSRKSLIILSQKLGNRTLEYFILNLRFDTKNEEIDLDGIFCESEEIVYDLCSISIEDLSLLEVSTLETILSSDSLRIESEDFLLKLILSLGIDYSSLLRHIKLEFLSSDGLLSFFDHIEYYDFTHDHFTGLVNRLKCYEDENIRKHRYFEHEMKIQSGLDSVIISSIASIFDVLKSKSYQLLYRGSRDGFDSKSLHQRIDGHSHTLTIIETTKGFIFGGYIACEWDSSGQWKCDDSLKSFLFTLKNPHHLSSRTFPLNPDRKQDTILCYPSAQMVWFGISGAIAIFDNCNVNNNSHNRGFGISQPSFVNDTGLPGSTLFTGEEYFTVKELEIFEILI